MNQVFLPVIVVYNQFYQFYGIMARPAPELTNSISLKYNHNR